MGAYDVSRFERSPQIISKIQTRCGIDVEFSMKVFGYCGTF